MQVDFLDVPLFSFCPSPLNLTSLPEPLHHPHSFPSLSSLPAGGWGVGGARSSATACPGGCENSQRRRANA